MQLRRTPQLTLLLSFAVLASIPAMAQDAPVKHGRKYKAPPATSRIEVTVLKKFNGKPIINAAVIFDSTLNGKERGQSRSQDRSRRQGRNRRHSHRQHRPRSGHRLRLRHLCRRVRRRRANSQPSRSPCFARRSSSRPIRTTTAKPQQENPAFRSRSGPPILLPSRRRLLRPPINPAAASNPASGQHIQAVIAHN